MQIPWTVFPPCRHRAREQGILIKVYASCEPDQKAAEPCYSVGGVRVEGNSTLTFLAKTLSAHQTPSLSDATRLACCRDPDESCRSEEALKNWTWRDAVNHGLKNRVYFVRGKQQGQPSWHYVLLSDKSEAYKEQFLKQVKSGNIDVAEWRYSIESGWEENPPEDLREKLSYWTSV